MSPSTETTGRHQAIVGSRKNPEITPDILKIPQRKREDASTKGVFQQPAKTNPDMRFPAPFEPLAGGGCPPAVRSSIAYLNKFNNAAGA
jgi:hypothetical protein